MYIFVILYELHTIFRHMIIICLLLKRCRMARYSIEIKNHVDVIDITAYSTFNIFEFFRIRVHSYFKL